MPDLILHHYPSSPFSEKIRLALGFKQLAWHSVTIPRIAPKPDVLALTGGYRRTPLLQIGADIYCDTALICDVLEHRQPAPTLYPEPEKGLGRVLAQWADSTLFWAAMAWNFQPRGRAQLFDQASAQEREAFARDRAAMSATGMTRLRPEDAASAYKSYLRRLSDMLDDRPYLLGEAPCIADLSAYHPLWFTRTRVPAVADILDFTPAVLDWMNRMALIGHGESTPMDAADAIALAAGSTPAPLPDEVFQDDHGLPLGARVTVAAETFGLEQTEGVLVAATRMHITLRREDDRAGTVHVHFPRIGYVLKAAE
ncbi:glutathione S-transferase family protein [Xylophilus sp. GOD-11R]|uniref:glutathione S-transferase family protein n=1 Tax=Xylophilus sp. GOD-11R TaxID=3089814 RepID=UPI00298BEBAF|nr:glutathione S-transferase family protein [Xylophilus sp. GOD-11R]WPB59255.1 glutathione S-transferase family protein [Xylophilus sp. GOD-11R]